MNGGTRRSPPPHTHTQKPRRGLYISKVMLISFFDARGLIYYEFLQRPLTMNRHVFQAILRRFDAAHARQRPHSIVHGCKFIHMDNASPHTAGDTVTLLRQLGWTRLPHPPYSPDLALSDFWFFCRLKKELRSRHFSTLALLKEAVADQVSQIPSAEYGHCVLQSWPKRWRHCQEYCSCYFEGMP